MVHPGSNLRNANHFFVISMNLINPRKRLVGWSANTNIGQATPASSLEIPGQETFELCDRSQKYVHVPYMFAGFVCYPNRFSQEKVSIHYLCQKQTPRWNWMLNSELPTAWCLTEMIGTMHSQLISLRGLVGHNPIRGLIVGLVKLAPFNWFQLNELNNDCDSHSIV